MHSKQITYFDKLPILVYFVTSIFVFPKLMPNAGDW